MQGRWQQVFGNTNPIIIELACGRGEYTVALARLHQHKNFIGIDVKGNRMYIGAKQAQEAGLQNAAFLRTQIEMLDKYFSAGEVSEIWITFPDPQLRTSKSKKRLTHPRFLRMYHKILIPDAPVHLKTDSPNLFNFTKKVIEFYGLKTLAETDDVYARDTTPELAIKTYYEGLNIARSNRIHYLQFSIPAILPDKDTALQEILRQTENTGVEQGIEDIIRPE